MFILIHFGQTFLETFALFKSAPCSHVLIQFTYMKKITAPIWILIL